MVEGVDTLDSKETFIEEVIFWMPIDTLYRLKLHQNIYITDELLINCRYYLEHKYVDKHFCNNFAQNRKYSWKSMRF